MPTITHAIVGGALGLILYSFSQDNNKRHFTSGEVIILALNSFIGPDWAKFLSPFYGSEYWHSQTFLILNGFSHSFIGWIITAWLFGILYWLILRYTTVEGREKHTSPVSYLHIVLIIIGAGMNHFALDMLDSSVTLFPSYLVPSTPSYSLESFLTSRDFAEGPLWESFSWVGTKELLFIGLIMMGVMIYFLKNKTLKHTWIISIGFALFIYGLIYLIGTNTVKNENDLGIIFYSLIGWIGPLFLYILSMEETHPLAKEKEEEKNSEKS